VRVTFMSSAARPQVSTAATGISLNRDRAAVDAAAILQIMATAPDHERLQTLENYLRDEFSDVEREAVANWSCRDA
jgi:hypothetical protein